MRTRELLESEIIITSSNNVLQLAMFNSDIISNPNTEPWSCYRVVNLPVGKYTNEELIPVVNTALKSAKSYTSSTHESLASVNHFDGSTEIFNFRVTNEHTIVLDVNYSLTFTDYFNASFCFVYHPRGVHKLPLFSKFCWLKINPGDSILWDYCSDSWRTYFYDTFCINCPFKNQTLTLSKKCNVRYTPNNSPNSSIMDANSSNPGILTIDQGIYEVEDFCNLLNALGSNVKFEKMRNCVHINIINVSSISSNFSNLCNASVSSSGTLDMYFYNQNICYFKIRKYQYEPKYHWNWYTYYTDYSCYLPPISGLGYSELMLDYCELFTNSLSFIRSGLNLNTFEETVENISCTITLDTDYTDPSNSFLYTIRVDAGLCSLLVDTDPVTNNNLYFYKSITLDDTILQNSFYSFFPNIIVCDSWILRQTINLNNVLIPIFNNFNLGVLKSNTPDIVTDKYVKQSLTEGFPLVNTSGSKLQNLFGVSTGDSTSHDYYGQSHLVLNNNSASMSNPSCLYKWGDDMSYLSIRFLGSEPETYFYVFGNECTNISANKTFALTSSNNTIYYDRWDHVGGGNRSSDISITLPTGNYTMVQFLELLKTNGVINYTKSYASGLFTFYIEYTIAIDTSIYSFNSDKSSIQNYYLWNRFFNLEFDYENADPSFPQLFYGWVPCIDYSCTYTSCRNINFVLNYMISVDDVIDNTVYTLDIPCGTWNVPQLIRFISMLPKQHNVNNALSGFDSGYEVYYETYPSEPNNVPFRLYRYRLFGELNRIKFVFLIDDNSILKNIPVFYESDMPMWPMSCVDLLTPVNFKSTIDFDIFCGLRTVTPGVNDIWEIVKKEEIFNASNTNNVVSLLKCYQTNCSNRGVQQLNSYQLTDIQESAKLVNIDYTTVGDPSSGIKNESNYGTYYHILYDNFRQGSSVQSSDSALYYSLRPRTNYKNTSVLRLGALPVSHDNLMGLNLTGVRTIYRQSVFSDNHVTMHDSTVFGDSTMGVANKYTIDGKYTVNLNKFSDAFSNGSLPIYAGTSNTIAPVNNDDQVSGGSTSLSLYTDNPDQFITDLQIFNTRGDINKIICIIEDPDNPGSYTTKTFEIFLWTGTTNNKTLEYTTSYFFDNLGTYNSTNNTIDISFGTSNFNIAYIDDNLYNIDTTPSLDFNSNTKSLLLVKNPKVKNSNIMYTSKNEVVNLDPNDHITVIPGASEIDYLTNTGCYWFMDEPTIINSEGFMNELYINIDPQLVNFVNTGSRLLNDRVYFYNPENIKSVRFLSCAIFNKLGIVVTDSNNSNSIAIDATLYLEDNSLTYDSITSNGYTLYNQCSQTFNSNNSCVFTLDQYIDPYTSNVFYCDKTTELTLIAENYYNNSYYYIDASLFGSEISMPDFNSGAELTYFSKCCVVEYDNGETQMYSQGKTLSGSYNNTPAMLIMHTYDQFININFLGAYNCLKLPHIINKNFTINNNTLSLNPGYYIFEICITFDKTYIKNTKNYANLSLLLYSLNPAINSSILIPKEYIWSTYSYQNSNTNYFTYNLYYHVCIDTATVYTPKIYTVIQGDCVFDVNIRYVIEKVI